MKLLTLQPGESFVAAPDVDRAINSLHILVDKYVRNEALREICCEVLTASAFAECPGGQKHHHAYRGGLAVHTNEVAFMALTMADASYGNQEVVVTAAVVHDFLKTREYVFNADGTIGSTAYRKSIRHVAGSYAWFASRCDYYRNEGFHLPLELTDHIESCVLSHHGRPDWGSAVEPQSVEGYILHASDMMSAFYGPGAKRAS